MVHTLDLALLEERLDQVPVLAGRPRSIERLSGGLTNVNLKVTTPDGAFVARCFHGDAALLGIDRDAEHLNTRAAASSGVGAPVVDFRSDLELMVIGFIDGVTYDNGSFAGPGVIERVAHACQALHSGPRFVNDFDMFARQRGYLGIVRAHGFTLPTGYESYDERFNLVREALAARAEPTVPCNNDLLAGNFVDDGRKLWLIDYEYSGNNEATFELGNVWSEAGLTLEQLDELMEAYDGTLLRHRVARARLWGLMSKYGWTLWASIQDGVSTIDFDFWGWGMEKYERALAEFDGPDFARLLSDATADD